MFSSFLAFTSLLFNPITGDLNTDHVIQIKSFPNKKVQQFYYAQNDALNDWLEIDSVVRYVADDIFESFDPDRDHDGILEHGGTLQAQGEDIEAFLPIKERESRRKSERSARRAINVRQNSSPTTSRYVGYLILYTNLSPDKRHSECSLAGREGDRLFLFLFPLPYRLYSRLSS